MTKPHNVNVSGSILSQSLPCFLCQTSLEKRTTKNGKPYFVCDSCGTQFFVRKKKGIERLAELIRELKGSRGAKPHLLAEIQQKLSEIEGLKAEIKKTEKAMGFFPNDELIRIRKSLKQRLEIVLGELDEITKKNSELNGPEKAAL